MLNSVGLQGPGVEAWLADDLPALDGAGARVVVSIWGRTVDEYAKRPALLADAPPAVVAVEVNLSCPNLEAGRDLFAHSPDGDARRRSRRPRAVRPAVVGEAQPERHRPRRRSRPRPREAGAEAVTLVNTVLGMAIDPETRRPRLGRPAAAGCRARPSTRSRCGPCTTCTPRCRTCRSSGSAAIAERRGRGRADAGGRHRGAGGHGHVRRPARARGGCCDELDTLVPARTASRRVAELTGGPCMTTTDDREPRAAGRRARRRRPRRRLPAGAKELQAVVRRGQGGPRALQRGRPRRRRRAARPRLRRVLRPEAPRHPHHRRAGGAGGRRARRALPQLPRRRGRRRCCGPASRASRRARPARACPTPIALAVTILTSDDGRAVARPCRRACSAALEAGCGGIVCAAADVHEAKQYGPRLVAVVPGIRPDGLGRARPGPRRHPARRHATRAPTCSWSAGRSRRRTTRRPRPRRSPRSCD